MAFVGTMSAEELRAEIRATNQEVQTEQVRGEELATEIAEAEERQRLRRELDEARERLEAVKDDNEADASYKIDIDADRAGPNRDHSVRAMPPLLPRAPGDSSGGMMVNCAHMVSRGEYVWKIVGMSWLKDMLWNEHIACAFSGNFEVGNRQFDMVYNPYAGHFPPYQEQCGSLAVAHYPPPMPAKMSLRYRIYVRARDGSYVQWGSQGHAYFDNNNAWHRGTHYGPDVHWTGHRPATLRSLGIFGLSHEELLMSEWVENDTMTVKCEVEVRPEHFHARHQYSPVADVPESSIIRDMQGLFEQGAGSDLQFLVQGEVINAHSQVLCARSDILKRQLTAGMKESVSKVIQIDDCDANTFRTFLKFLYTDQFPSLDELAGVDAQNECNPVAKLSLMQSLLAVSHKYEVARLQCWCEKQLCQHLLDAEAVCGMLQQAHLLQTKHLERACLTYIKDHMTEVTKSTAYVELMTAWPQIMLKLSRFIAGAPDADGSGATDPGAV